ncbi:hypothetical protein XENOCAPTIV_012043 [Xenoophorus captivus]|uniref:Uncharacterized protein n=1 Tax=Xenoophorus captivus TaxID=1517983 RepID=A0ABV0QD44_9TELE
MTDISIMVTCKTQCMDGWMKDGWMELLDSGINRNKSGNTNISTLLFCHTYSYLKIKLQTCGNVWKCCTPVVSKVNPWGLVSVSSSSGSTYLKSNTGSISGTWRSR